MLVGYPPSTLEYKLYASLASRDLLLKHISVRKYQSVQLSKPTCDSIVFNLANKERGYADEEYREKFGDEEFKAMITERIRQKKRYNLKLASTEKAFMQAYPGLVDEV